jgi:hypothetical protein
VPPARVDDPVRTTTRCALVACLLALIAPATGFGRVQNNHVAPEKRIAAGGRDLQIVVAQAEIQSSINPANVALLGGALLALADAGINNSMAQSAEKKIVPLREALTGYEFDPLVQKASIATLSGFEWFDLKETRLSKDASEPGLVSALNGAGTPQVMFLSYSYMTDPHFSSVVVTLTASLVNKAMPKNKRVQKPSMRFWMPYLPFNRTVRSVIQLPNADSWDPEANVRAWSADGGKLARAALDLGVQRCQQLLKRSLEMTASEAADMQKRKKRRMSRVPAVTGWIIESDASHMLVYSGQNNWLTYFEKTDAPMPAPATPEPATPVQ